MKRNTNTFQIKPRGGKAFKIDTSNRDLEGTLKLLDTSLSGMKNTPSNGMSSPPTIKIETNLSDGKNNTINEQNQEICIEVNNFQDEEIDIKY